LIGVLVACGGEPVTSGTASVPVEAYRALLLDLERDYRLSPDDVFVFVREAHVAHFAAGYTSDRFWSHLAQEMPSLTRDTYDDFWVRNGHDEIPGIDRAGKCAVVRVTKVEIEQLIGSGSEEEQSKRFAARYPNGVLVQVSAIGLSRNRRQGLAFVYVSRWAASICVLTKSGGRWEVSDSLGMIVGD